MADHDQRDTPRPGRPPDLPGTSSASVDAEITGELTPPPQPLPILPRAARERAKAATANPAIPEEIRIPLAESLRRTETLYTAVDELITHARELHPMRHAPDQMLELSSEIGHLKARLEAMEREGPGAEDAAQALAQARELEIILIGRDGNNGRFGTLARDVRQALEAMQAGLARDLASHRCDVDEALAEISKDVAKAAKDAATGRKRVNWFFGLAIGCLAGSAAIVLAGALASANHSGAQSNQIENNNRRLDRLERQIDRIPGALFLPAPSTQPAGGPTP